MAARPRARGRKPPSKNFIQQVYMILWYKV